MHIQFSEAAVFCYDRDIDWERTSHEDRLGLTVEDTTSEEVLPLREGISIGWLYPLTESTHRHRPNGHKAATFRSWRNPRAIGGGCRKATARKLKLRMLPAG